MDFTLGDADDKWAREIYAKVTTEVRTTLPDGGRFQDTLIGIFDRDRNWVKWKNDNCGPMDTTAQAARERRAEVNKGKSNEDLVREEVERWNNAFKRLVPATEYGDGDPPQPFGSLNLEQVWERGVTGLRDLENPYGPGELEELQERIKELDEERDRLRKKKGLPPIVEKPVQQQQLRPGSRPSTPMMPSPGTAKPSEPAGSSPLKTGMKEEETGSSDAPLPASTSANADLPMPPLPTPAPTIAQPQATRLAVPPVTFEVKHLRVSDEELNDIETVRGRVNISSKGLASDPFMLFSSVNSHCNGSPSV